MGNSTSQPDIQQGFTTTIHNISLSAYQTWARRLDHLPLDQCEELFLPLRHAYEGPGLCSTQGRVTLTMPLYTTSLEAQIERRISTKNHFAESELVSLCYRLLKAATFFQIRGEKLSTLTPQRILLKAGEVRVISEYSTPNGSNNFIDAIERRGRPLLSPEELCQLGQGNFYPTSRSGMDETFIIGLILLQCAVLQHSSDLIDLSVSHINHQQLRLRLHEAQGRYKVLTKLISTLTQDDRPCAGQMLYFLIPCEQNILTGKPFTLNASSCRANVQEFIKGWNQHFQQKQPKVIAPALLIQLHQLQDRSVSDYPIKICPIRCKETESVRRNTSYIYHKGYIPQLRIKQAEQEVPPLVVMDEKRRNGVAVSERVQGDKWRPNIYQDLTASSIRRLRGGPMESVKGPVVEWNFD